MIPYTIRIIIKSSNIIIKEILYRMGATVPYIIQYDTYQGELFSLVSYHTQIPDTQYN